MDLFMELPSGAQVSSSVDKADYLSTLWEHGRFMFLLGIW